MLDEDVVVLKKEGASVCGRAAELVDGELIRELYGISAEIHTWTAADGERVKSIYTGVRKKD